MINSFFFKICILTSITFLVLSCDKDYSAVGEDLIRNESFAIDADTFEIISETKKTGPIASNNLAVNSLGVFENELFGQTTANFATQVQLTSVAPVIDFNLKQKVDSVSLYIPYYSKRVTSSDKDGVPGYTLDSIYGTKTNTIRLKIFENKFPLDGLNTEEGAPRSDPSYPQLYYTHQDEEIKNIKGVSLYENNSFIFSSTAVIATFKTGTTAATYKSPGLEVKLDNKFFYDLLFDKTRPNYDLSSNPNFENYFRGLYFQVEKNNDSGVLARMNFKEGKITVYYNEQKSTTDTNPIKKTITLNLTGNTVSLLKNESTTKPNSYSIPNENRLYLKGGEGSIAAIDLFKYDESKDTKSYNRTTKKIELNKGNGIPDELDEIKEKQWLINDASLTLHIDQEIMGTNNRPNKIILYDLSTNQIITSATIQDNLKYKLNITNYLRNIMNTDLTNFKVGVAISHSISNVNFKKIKNAPLYSRWVSLSTEEKNAYSFPETSILSSSGVIFYGSSSANPGDKRLKLEIYFTKPK